MTGVLSKVGSHVGKEVDNMWKKTFKTKICGWLQAALDVDNSTVCDPITLEFRRTTSFVGQKCPCKGCPFISSSYWNYVVHATYVHEGAAPAYSCCGQDIEERKALNHRRSHKSDLKKNLGCLFRSVSFCVQWCVKICIFRVLILLLSPPLSIPTTTWSRCTKCPRDVVWMIRSRVFMFILEFTCLFLSIFMPSPVAV